jgi:gluconolactonase
MNIFQRNIVLSFTVYVFLSFTDFSLAQTILNPNATLEKIASGISQPEGPVWKDGVGLLFSDINGNKIYKWTSGNSSEIFINHSDSTNGLTYDLQGRLIAGQMGKRRIVRFESDGTQTEIASEYLGKRFNSPNDLVVKSDGSIFFTDPDFNIPSGGSAEIFINGKYVKGLYRISPIGNVQLLDASFDKPNGICFSPDEKKLYVNESPKGIIYVWDVVDDTTITNKKEFAKLSSGGYSDGTKTDSAGNVYCTGPQGVWVYSPTGEYIGKISLPNNASASNCAWGEADRKTLFITEGGTGNKSVYKIRPLLTGVKDETGFALPKFFELNQNYPNPFNPSTNICYKLPGPGNVSLIIYDTLGNKIATLLNEYKTAGNYSIQFSAAEFQISSGIYFYSLSCGNYSAAKKMIYLK